MTMGLSERSTWIISLIENYSWGFGYSLTNNILDPYCCEPLLLHKRCFRMLQNFWGGFSASNENSNFPLKSTGKLTS